MDNPATDYARLSLLVQRILDADLLRDTDGAALQGEAEAARRSQEEGDTETARQHVAQIALFTEALVNARALKPTDGLAIIETTRRLLVTDTD